MFDISGKIAVITGGSSGIGEAAAYALAACGAQVVICGTNLEKARRVTDAIAAKGYPCEARQADVSDSASVNALMNYVAEKYGKIDILFSNAGIVMDQTLEEITDADWYKMMNVNVAGCFFSCRAAFEHMKKRGYGKIIITSSVGGKMSHPTAGVHYISSKGALLAFTRHFANQVSQFGVTVNCIAPGTTDTPLIGHRSADLKKAIAAKIPMLRLGAAADMAGAVVYLASDCSNFVTGEIVDINGGLYID